MEQWLLEELKKIQNDKRVKYKEMNPAAENMTDEQIDAIIPVTQQDIIMAYINRMAAINARIEEIKKEIESDEETLESSNNHVLASELRADIRDNTILLNRLELEYGEVLRAFKELNKNKEEGISR